MTGKGNKKNRRVTVVGINKDGKPYKHEATKGKGRNMKVRTKVNKRTGVATYRPAKQPKMVTVKRAPAFDSKKRKVRRRKYGKKI